MFLGQQLMLTMYLSHSLINVSVWEDKHSHPHIVPFLCSSWKSQKEAGRGSNAGIGDEGSDSGQGEAAWHTPWPGIPSMGHLRMWVH